MLTCLYIDVKWYTSNMERINTIIDMTTKKATKKIKQQLKTPPKKNYLQKYIENGQKVAKTGRPTVLSRQRMAKLMQCLELGHTIEYSCNFAGISKDTYFYQLKVNPDFATRVDLAKHYQKHKALDTVAYHIDKKDLTASQWYLERKYRSEYGKESSNITINNTPAFRYDVIGETQEADTEDIKEIQESDTISLLDTELEVQS